MGFMQTSLPPTQLVSLPGKGWLPIRYYAHPTPAASVLLLHGWSVGSDLHWLPHFQALQGTYTTVSFDQRFHGNGLRGSKKASLELLADDAASVLDSLQISSAIVVGYSMGGAVAQLLARSRPDLVSGLVLSATSTRFDSLNSAFPAFRFAHPAAVVSRTLPGFVHKVAAEYLYGRRLPKSYGAWARSELVDHDWRGLLSLAADISRFDSRPWVSSLQTPSVYIGTTKDELVLPSAQEDLRTRLSCLRGSYSSSFGHEAVLTDPEFTNILCKSISDVRTP